MREPDGASGDGRVETAGGGRPARPEGGALRRLVVGLLLGGFLGGCAIPFGEGGLELDSGSPEETRRERNRLFLEEQERVQRERLLDRGGPSGN